MITATTIASRYLEPNNCGSQPVFDAHGKCVGITYSTPATLLQELGRMVNRNGLALADALRFFTENPARVMGLAGVKGTVCPGADADLLVLDENYSVLHVTAQGKTLVANGEAVCKGTFEE